MMLTPEQEELVKKNESLVYYFLKKLDLTYDTFEYSDAEAAALFGLCKAAKTFDESRRIKFSTYASQCIKNEIFMLLRKRKKNEKEISINSSIHEDNEGNEQTYEDILKSPNSNIEERIYKNESIERALTYVLNYFQPIQSVAFLYYLGGHTQKTTSKMLGFSQSYVSRVIKQVIKNLNFFENIKAPIRGGDFSFSYSNEKYLITFDSDIAQYAIMAYSKMLNKFDSKDSGLLRNELRDFFNSPPKYTIGWNNKKLILYLPNTLDSFTLLAMLIQEFYSCIPATESQKEISENTVKKTSPPTNIVDYILTLSNEFSIESVAEYFSNSINLSKIKTNLQILKLKGKIRQLPDGKFIVVKNNN